MDIDIIHIIKEKGPPYKGLCGTKSNWSAFASIKDLKDKPIRNWERLCKTCAKHPDYPLMVLGNIGG